MSAHLYFMQLAMALAEKARLHAPPNPWVGCVIVNHGEIVGRGFTQPPGQAHAEVGALLQAGERAKGATLYSTLEPCSHTGRTPPCTQALIKAGISKVYYGIQDPDLKVKGKGVRQLEEVGIQVFGGIGEEEIQRSLVSYLYQRQTGLPYTILKSALSVDGSLAAQDGTSQWISCPQARQDAHLYRAKSQAIVIGSGTALKDSPQLTVRHPSYASSYQPLRVLLDSQGRVPASGPLFDRQIASTLVVTTSEGAMRKQKEWESAGAEVSIVNRSSTGLNLEETWQLLGKRMILQVLVESGATLSTALLKTSLVNRLVLYMAPLLLGSSGMPFFQSSVTTLKEAQRLTLQEVKKIGECVRIEYQVQKF